MKDTLINMLTQTNLNKPNGKSYLGHNKECASSSVTFHPRAAGLVCVCVIIIYLKTCLYPET